MVKKQKVCETGQLLLQFNSEDRDQFRSFTVEFLITTTRKMLVIIASHIMHL
jgi:hypothetical protein